MNSQAQPILGATITCDAPPIIKTGRLSPSRLSRVLIFPVKLFWGMAFCQGFLGSIFVVGWTYRLAQRSVLKYWWCRSRRAQRDETFAEFLAADERTNTHLHWPNWFAGQNFREAIRRRPGASAGSYILSLLRAPVHSLGLNCWIGLRAILNTWVLTLPACLFWWFGWYDGWNNSFNKGYEQAAVGPLISILGIVWFIAAMFYVPLAQARQAASGEWRSFYQFRLIWSVVRLRWLSCVGLALLYTLFALPLHILKTAPMFSPQQHPALATLADAQVVKYLDGYFFWCALMVLPAYVILRLVAARIYASGILSLVQTGKVPPSALAESERDALERLDLSHAQPQRDRHFFMRFVAWAGTRVGRIVGSVALVLIWFSFVAQIYIAEFFKHHAALGWINQPLIQLPWFHYLPVRLKNPAAEVFGATLILLAALLVWSVIRACRRRKV